MHSEYVPKELLRSIPETLQQQPTNQQNQGVQYFQGGNLSKNWYKKWLKKSKAGINIHRIYTYFLDNVTNGLELELNELPSQYSRSTYPSSHKENEVISAEIMKLIKNKIK